MIPTPIVEELILAGRTPGGARTMFEVDYKRKKVRFGSPPLYMFGTIRICPPLRVPRRFRAFVTWLPTGYNG